MMARGFKPVGWVAGVAAAALGCYMLSLNVASERAELTKLERQIIMAKRDIRDLQTELGTRGRLQQLESWNANVLALSAPTSAQFLDNELTLARFDRSEQSIEEKSVVHMASAPQNAPKIQQKVEAPVHFAAAPLPQKRTPSLVHQASLNIGDAKPALPVVKLEQPKALGPLKAAVAQKKPEQVKVASAERKTAEPSKKKSSGISDKLAKDIGAAVKAEEAPKSQKARSVGGQ